MFFFIFFFFRGTLYGRDGRRNFRGDHFNWKPEVLVSSLRVKSDQRANSPPPNVLFFPSASDRNFEKAIIFNIVHRSYNNASRADKNPRARRDGL